MYYLLQTEVGAGNITEQEESWILNLKEILERYVPAGISEVVIVLFLFTFCIVFVKYNAKLLALLGKLSLHLTNMVNKLLGKPIKNMNKTLQRTANLNKDSIIYAIYRYFEVLIENMDLHSAGVTVGGMLLFMSIVSVIMTCFLSSIFHFGTLFPICAIAVFIIIMIIFRVVASTKVETREEAIMDTVDLLVSDIKGGVQNTILKYITSIDPTIKPYFENFLDSIDNRHTSFSQAMMQLNKDLGITFTDFAHKSIYYERKADKGLEDIFSDIIEKNKNRRILRDVNNRIFANLRIQLVLSLIIIGIFAVVSVLTDSSMRMILTQTTIGRLLIIADILVVGIVMGYITNVKAKSL